MVAADVEHLAETISGDKPKLRHALRARRASRPNSARGVRERRQGDRCARAKTDALEQRLGPEYDKVMEGLDQIDF